LQFKHFHCDLTLETIMVFR